MFSPVADHPAVATRSARQVEVLCLKVHVLARCFAHAAAALSRAGSEIRGLSPAFVRWALVWLKTLAASPVAACAGAAVTTLAPTIRMTGRTMDRIRARITALLCTLGSYK